MNVILPVAIYAALALIGLGLLGMGVSGLRSLVYGKVQTLSILIVGIPAVVILVLRGTMETWAQAGIFTLVVMFALALLALLFAGLRSVFI